MEDAITHTKEEIVMRWRYEEMKKRYQRRTGELHVYRTITEATGITAATLSAIATGQREGVEFGTIEKLLAFFSARLGEELTTNDLLEWRPD